LVVTLQELQQVEQEGPVPLGADVATAPRSGQRALEEPAISATTP
jgi:hypothetical protein